MEFYDATFFGPVKVSLRRSTSEYPFSIGISPEGELSERPQVVFFLRDEKDLIAFKNSVISEFDRLKRK